MPSEPVRTAPFVPLIQVRSATLLAARDIPYEPTVPGQSTRHCTLSAYSCMVWFSPWQAKLLLGFIDQVQQKLQVHLSALKAGPAVPGVGAAAPSVGGDSAAAAAGAAPAAAQPPSPSPAAAPPLQQAGTNEPGSANSTGSRVSLLLDLPLLTLFLSAEVPSRPGQAKQDASTSM